MKKEIIPEVNKKNDLIRHQKLYKKFIYAQEMNQNQKN